MVGKYIARGDALFPTKLLSEKIKPQVKELWFRGVLEQDWFTKTVAIVGSRRMSRYGKQVLAEIVPRFVAAGYTTISGFMYGIDTEVYRLTIENGGKTVAVLGYGIERDDIEVNSKSLFLSEYPGETGARVWTFPQRNRIVVGLSDMVVVVEAGLKSGSLNSASWARRQGKPVFAVPGSIFSSTSEGSNILISEGKATSLTLARLYQALGKDEQLISSEKVRNNQHNLVLSIDESTLVTLLKLDGPLSVNELARKAGKPVGEVAASLTSLLIRGQVKEERGVWSPR
ncbi:MAG: DNA-protecting protein DprA [bacterium]